MELVPGATLDSNMNMLVEYNGLRYSKPEQVLDQMLRNEVTLHELYSVYIKKTKSHDPNLPDSEI
jgi:hypothetical protein